MVALGAAGMLHPTHSLPNRLGHDRRALDLPPGTGMGTESRDRPHEQILAAARSRWFFSFLGPLPSSRCTATLPRAMPDTPTPRHGRKGPRRGLGQATLELVSRG